MKNLNMKMKNYENVLLQRMFLTEIELFFKNYFFIVVLMKVDD